jgi:hypothetical protein
VPRRTSTLIIVCTLALSASGASAQRDSATTARGWLVGVSAGLPGYDKEPVPELFTIGLNVSQVIPGRLGADFSIGTMPRALIAGAAVLGARAGVALPMAPTPDVLLLPSAGVSLLGGAGEGGGAAIAGVNAGIAAVIWTDDVGVRTGITWHRFQDFRGAIWLVEFGVVHR